MRLSKPTTSNPVRIPVNPSAGNGAQLSNQHSGKGHADSDIILNALRSQLDKLIKVEADSRLNQSVPNEIARKKRQFAPAADQNRRMTHKPGNQNHR